jgi:dTDP-4-dehydrorhamnose 3,5-epimerase-like enzyme
MTMIIGGRGKSFTFKFPVIPDARGNLTFVEGNRHVPFEMNRVYYLYDVPSGAARGGHAHKDLEQVLISLSGSFDVTVDNGVACEKYSLNRSHIGLYIGPMVWREMENFSSNAICLVLASKVYDEGDYYRDYDQFIKGLAEPS